MAYVLTVVYTMALEELRRCTLPLFQSDLPVLHSCRNSATPRTGKLFRLAGTESSSPSVWLHPCMHISIVHDVQPPDVSKICVKHAAINTPVCS